MIRYIGLHRDGRRRIIDHADRSIDLFDNILVDELSAVVFRIKDQGIRCLRIRHIIIDIHQHLVVQRLHDLRHRTEKDQGTILSGRRFDIADIAKVAIKIGPDILAEIGAVIVISIVGDIAEALGDRPIAMVTAQEREVTGDDGSRLVQHTGHQGRGWQIGDLVRVVVVDIKILLTAGAQQKRKDHRDIVECSSHCTAFFRLLKIPVSG
jgi:hypothetical protein